MSRIISAVALIALSIHWPASSQESQSAAGSALRSEVSQNLYLEVEINGERRSGLHRFLLRERAIFAPKQTLAEIGLHVDQLIQPSSGLIELPIASFATRHEYLAQTQQLRIEVPVKLLDRKIVKISANEPASQPAPAAPAAGLLLSYDLYAQEMQQAAGSSSSLSASTQLRVPTMGGMISNGFVQSISRGSGTNKVGNVRLDTSWQRDFLDSETTLSIGDLYTGAISSTRSAHIGGIRFSKNFALQPTIATSPLAVFSGDAALPSVVDLYINGVQQAHRQVGAGSFELQTQPTITGAGMARMLITDVNGQQRSIEFPLYATPNLLREGLTDWSVELGTLRKEFGQSSFSYSDAPMTSATLRYGARDDVTFEAHGEVGSSTAMADLGGLWKIRDQLGVVSASAARSKAPGQSGYQLGTSYQWSGTSANVLLQTTRASKGFLDVLAVNDSPISRRTDQIFIGTSHPWADVGISYVRQTYPAEAAVQVFGANLSHMFKERSVLTLSVSVSEGSTRTRSVVLGWSAPLGKNATATTSFAGGEKPVGLTTSANGWSGPDDDSWSWRLGQRLPEADAESQAQVTHTTPYGQWFAGLDYQSSTAGGRTALVTGGYSGSAVILDGDLMMSRQIQDAYALVSTGGVANIPVLVENRVVGMTDSAGHFLVTRLNSSQPSKISIDTLQLPLNLAVGLTTIQAVPARQSGMLVDFKIAPVLSLEIVLKGADGKNLPVGSDVRVVSKEGRFSLDSTLVTQVGYDGLVYLENPPSLGQIQVTSTSGNECRADLPIHSLGASGVMKREFLSCR
jgi:outer membrane usher protein